MNIDKPKKNNIGIQEIPNFIILTEEERKHNTTISKYVEFKLINLTTKPLQIFYEKNNRDPLIYITTIQQHSFVYMYPVMKDFVPHCKKTKDCNCKSLGCSGRSGGGGMLFSKFEEDEEGEFAFQPYPLDYKDYNIYFGSISTDFLNTRDTYSESNEILSLKIINKSLKRYHVWYRDDYLGVLDGYFPSKHKVQYTMITTNNDKHFQLGTCVDFIIDAPNANKESVLLTKKYINMITVGDVLGTTELNQ